MDKSLFSIPSSSKYSHLSNSSHELPRWRTPSPMSASVIPPPIIESTYQTPPHLPVRSTVVGRPTLLQSRQHELEADLQYLLDAQAEGLTGGLDQGVFDDRTSTGSTTPTAQSVRSTPGSVRSRPIRRKMGIRSARKGIYNSMLALSDVKAEEIQDIEDEVRINDQTMEKITTWQRKKQKLEEASKDVDSSEDTVRSQRLRQEADVLQEEINHVELQLADMKARQRKLLKEVAAAENATQAKLASYTSSLRLLEEDVQKFLAAKPSKDAPPSTSRGDSAPLWQLPAKRRTLDIAKQYYTHERETVIQQRESIDLEKAALDEGAVMWKSIVVSLSDLERQLRVDMKATAEGQSSDFPSNQPRCSPELLARMDESIRDLESRFELATSRSWNLLIAAIGAELDALKQGRRLLGGDSYTSNDSAAHGEASQSGEPSPSSGDEIRQLDKSFETTKRPASNGLAPEDDPDPELLFSQHDVDSE